MQNSISNLNECDFINTIKKIQIPKWDLSNIEYLEFYWDDDNLYLKYSLNKITSKININSNTKNNVKSTIKNIFNQSNQNINMGGCYWLWTNEPIHHYLHTHKTPDKFDGGEIIYNGISDKGLINRVLHHIFGNEKQAWSGIGIDIYKYTPPSHFKKAYSEKGKIPLLKNSIGEYNTIKYKNMLHELNLSKDEIKYINDNHNNNVFYFRNGICLTDDKHKGYKYRIYFTPGETETYRNYIESSWRDMYGLPRLCSYSKR